MRTLAKLKVIFEEDLRQEVKETAAYGMGAVVDIVDFYKETQEATTIKELKAVAEGYGYDEDDWEIIKKQLKED